MKSLPFLLAAATLAAAAALSPAQAGEAERLIDEWKGLNSQCRGGSGDDPATMRACDEREALTKRISKLNWCYGKIGQYGYQTEWHPCGRDSVRPDG